MFGQKILNNLEDRFNDSDVKDTAQSFLRRVSGSGPSRVPWLVAGLALGAAAMYLLDPDKGASRRKMIKTRGMEMKDDIAEAGSYVVDRVKSAVQGASDTAEDTMRTAKKTASRAQASIADTNRANH